MISLELIIFVKIINICADIEDQLSGLDKNEKETFMQDIGLSKTGLNQLIKEGYDLLKLDTFLFYLSTNLILNLAHINNQLRGLNEKNN